MLRSAKKFRRKKGVQIILSFENILRVYARQKIDRVTSWIFEFKLHDPRNQEIFAKSDSKVLINIDITEKKNPS